MHSFFRTVFVALLFTCSGTVFSQHNSADEAIQSTEETLIRNLKNFVDEQAKIDVFSGTILLAKNEKVLFTAARGMASKRFGVPNNLQTKLNLGSMNKMFTATAVMRMVESEQIDLDDKLSQFLDESWLPHTISSKIEIQHLLTHASGLGSYFTKDFFEASKMRFRKLDDFKPLLVNEALAFEPGSDYRYSNTGMLLLGAVIEEVTKLDYFEYIRRNIYQPANMLNSDCYEMDQPVPNLAIGYNAPTKSSNHWSNNLFWHVIKGGPAGGCFSTAEDLHKFSLALIQHRLLNRHSTEMLYSLKPEFHEEAYGYGFKISGTPTDRIIGHSGGFVGIDGNLDIFLDREYIAVVLSNHGGGARPIVKKIRDLINLMEG